MGSYNNKSVVCRVILPTQFRLNVIVLINRIVTMTHLEVFLCTWCFSSFVSPRVRLVTP